MKISLAEHLKKIPLPATPKWPEGVWDVDALLHGSMTLLLYTPKGKDYQTPHEQDELYIVVQGKGVLEVESIAHSFDKGDALFVRAGEEHRFTEFSDDIQLWAIFWGPKGGEAKK